MHGLMKEGRHMKRLKEYHDSMTDEFIKGVYTKTKKTKQKKFLRKINTRMARDNNGTY